MLRCFAYRFHHDFTSHYRATINVRRANILVKLSDIDDELETEPGSEGEVAQYPEGAVNTFTVQHGIKHVIQCCTESSEIEQ